MNMNRVHRRLCSGSRWGAFVRSELLPNALDGVDLGDHLLELGPGPGLTTDVLRTKVAEVTALELEPDLAARLERRQAPNVHVVRGDATQMPFADDTFSASVCFTMLHHVPTPALQDRLFSETCRVLRPGGVFAGADSAPGRFDLGFRLLHIGDTMNLVPPATLAGRLQAAGFTAVHVRPAGGRVYWRAVAAGRG